MMHRPVQTAVRLALLWSAFACAAACGPQDRELQTGSRVAAQAAPLEWTEVQRLVAGDGEFGDKFGWSVAISGDHAIVGANPQVPESEEGAYVFEREADGSWIEAERLTASDAVLGDHFGISVAIAGDVAIVGAPYAGANGEGAAYVFERNADGEWLEVENLTAPGAPSDVSRFGMSLAVSSDLLVVGAPGTGTSSTATVYVFEREAGGSSWTPAGTLVAGDSQDSRSLGYSVAVSEDVVLVGAPYADALSESEGAAYVFERDANGQWTDGQRLTASDGQANDRFGHSVVVSGGMLVVGAPGAEGQSGQDGGAVYLFERDGDSWLDAQKLTPSDGQEYDQFGHSVAVSGDMLLAGSPFLGASDDGAIYVFERTPPASGSWSEVMQLFAIDGDAGDQFGTAMTLADGTMIVGAPFTADASGFDVGAAYVFELRSSDGDPCPAQHECVSGHCVDGVCCDSECGGGDSGDCVACSVAAGASADGSCEPVPDGTACDAGVCASGVCEPLDLGLACSDDGQCASEHCVDEVCCEEPSCSPYRCQADTGQCGALCLSDLDCVEGFRCTSGGLCEQEETAGDDDGGCGCRQATPRPAGPWGALALLGLAMALSWRRLDGRRAGPPSR